MIKNNCKFLVSMPSIVRLDSMCLVAYLILIAAGGVVAHWYSATLSLDAWIARLALFVFAWTGRSIATRESCAPTS